MKRIYILIPMLLLLCCCSNIHREQPGTQHDYLALYASGDDPVYTTYTADTERARLYGDKGYKMDYYSCGFPLRYSSEKGGSLYSVWEIDDVVVNKMSEYHAKPVIKYSFSDMVITNYSPMQDISVEERFVVYSSSLAYMEYFLSNTSNKSHKIEIYPILEIDDSLKVISFENNLNGYLLQHYESKKRLISNLYRNAPYPTFLRDVLVSNVPLFSYGGYQGSMSDFYTTIKTDFYSDHRNDSLNLCRNGSIDFAALHIRLNMNPGEIKKIRIFRGIQDSGENYNELEEQISNISDATSQEIFEKNVALFQSIPRLSFITDKEKMVYISAFNLARGCMLPPAGATSFNFYAFSREPLWGWGHGHQVLHESLSMLAYAYLDAESAEGSQEVYIEQQRDDGLIAYRHGPRGRQEYPHYSRIWNDTMASTSAPFFNWINWEIYLVGQNKDFLEKAYESGKKYTKWLIENRDSDGDGLYEWGPYGIIENVRDWYNAVFQVSAERYLDVDKEDISDELECLDLSLMIVNELKHLSLMATELDMEDEADLWNQIADKTAKLINEIMWDEKTSFFYHVNRIDHSFNFMGRDLKRQEIIGFLPLWAGIVTEERATSLIETLTDTSRFWRKYGIPTLAANDEWYSPYVDYCCKWNGPVWLLWDYMLYRGLKNYGYHSLASELADKMMLAVTTQLSKNHNFWESYSPDYDVLNSPSNYIWDAIMARLLIDEYTHH